MIVKTARQYLFLLPRDRRELGANLIKMFPADLTGPSRAGRLLSVGPDFKCQHSDGGGERPESLSGLLALCLSIRPRAGVFSRYKTLTILHKYFQRLGPSKE